DYKLPDFASPYQQYYDVAAENADMIITYSSHAKNEIVTKLGVSPERIQVTPLAPPTNFRPNFDRSNVDANLSELGLHGTKFILYVSTIEPRKNHETLIRAFARLKQIEPALKHKLVFAGAKWLDHERVFDTISQVGLIDEVIHLGFAKSLESLY